LKTTRRCCGGFAISAPWYKWLYLLTYLLTTCQKGKTRKLHFFHSLY